ncbi:hypothetical protein B0T11DRAFT_269174 [Plectosphaerella cucumerina]|uniref:Uncharacterized protein n=1 Tax=Plectosphaerella cucumerina TaxID=40658 RepID=A0A8K0TUB3_9PEZI|nr:hypothetical protein B0T11DRAFT_269174 [Plectosphaerella cucumerina]
MVVDGRNAGHVLGGGRTKNALVVLDGWLLVLSLHIALRGRVCVLRLGHVLEPLHVLCSADPRRPHVAVGAKCRLGLLVLLHIPLRGGLNNLLQVFAGVGVDGAAAVLVDILLVHLDLLRHGNIVPPSLDELGQEVLAVQNFILVPLLLTRLEQAAFEADHLVHGSDAVADVCGRLGGIIPGLGGPVLGPEGRITPFVARGGTDRAGNAGARSKVSNGRVVALTVLFEVLLGQEDTIGGTDLSCLLAAQEPGKRRFVAVHTCIRVQDSI